MKVTIWVKGNPLGKIYEVVNPDANELLIAASKGEGIFFGTKDYKSVSYAPGVISGMEYDWSSEL